MCFANRFERYVSLSRPEITVRSFMSIPSSILRSFNTRLSNTKTCPYHPCHVIDSVSILSYLILVRDSELLPSSLITGLVKRKILVLDLDETLIHSHHDGVVRQMVSPGTPPDFILRVNIDRHPVRFFVHKRPHVDFFLETVIQRTKVLSTNVHDMFLHV